MKTYIHKLTLPALLALATVNVWVVSQDKPAAANAADQIRQADEARKRHDLSRAASLLANAQKSNDFKAGKPPIDLILAVGDYHFAKGSLESQDLALATYDLAFSVYGDGLGAFDVAQVRARRSEVLSWQGKLDLARDEINSLRTAYKNDRRVNLLADLASANILLLSNQAQAAKDALTPLVEINDSVITPQAMFAMGRAYVQLKQPEQAVATFRSLWNRYGESDFVKRAVYLIGQVYFDRGDFLEARKLYEACAVVGAAMQTSVRVGDELIIKVSDPDYFARTQSQVLDVQVTVPSGDQETVRLEKNQVSDQLYIGRIQTALLLPNLADRQLQVAGSDVIDISYTGQTGKPYQVRVVDDGTINLDSVALTIPTPRHERSLPRQTTQRPTEQKQEPIVIPTGKLTSGSVSPGSPIYVQLVDADLDTTNQPDTATAEVLATNNNQTIDTVQITLTETAGRSGVFVGTAATEEMAADATASSQTKDNPSWFAIDDNNSTFWKAAPGSLKEGQKHFIEINLRRPSELATLKWGPTEGGKKNAPTAMRIILRGENTDITIPYAGKASSLDNTVDLKKTFARTVRIEIDSFEGDAPAIGQLIIVDAQNKQLVPTGVDPNAPQRKTHLAFDVGHQVSARFVDEENESPGRKTTRQSRKLGVRYHDAQPSFALAVGEGEMQRLSPAWRIERDARQWLVINDPDMDVTPEKDVITLKVFTEIGDSQELTAEETGAATGSFVAALPLAAGQAAMDNPRLLRMGDGDILWTTYDDERNMTPGYRTFRNAWVLDNQPTVGDFAPRPLVTTAWPFEVKPTADGEMQAVQREMGKGRVTLEYVDPDAFANATRTITTRLNALVGETATELTLLPNAQGKASVALDLVLGDKDTAAQVDAGDSRSRSEWNVTGDDILRIAITDEQVATADTTARSILDANAVQNWQPPTEAALKDVVPVIHMSDPIRRMQAEQSSRLDALKTEMGYRLLAYRMNAEQWTKYRKPIEKRLADVKDDPELTEALKRQLLTCDTQLGILTARAERLKSLGAQEAKTFAEPVPVEPLQSDPAAAIRNGSLIPGQPFEIEISDPDLQEATVNVRLRSINGVLVDVLAVKASRQPDGQYKARVETERSSERSDTSRLSLMPGGQVLVDYTDPTEIKQAVGERVQYLALASDASIRSLNSNYVDEVSQIRLGQEIYLEVTDFDADRTSGIDAILAEVKSSSGDVLNVVLTETESHSGLFRGMFKTDFANPVAGDDVLQAGYGGSIEVAYTDFLRQNPTSPARQLVNLRIIGGSNGNIEMFSRQFRDTREEMELWFRTGQAAYHVGRKLYLSGTVARAEEYLIEASDYFNALVTRFPDDPFAASSNYYLGNIQSLRGHHREALERFQQVVTRWPKSEFVPQARFKIGQAYEGLAQFDQATDAYVLLTYHHPDDTHVPLSMIRMMNHYARGENWTDAVNIAQRFVGKFPSHEQAGAVALKAGQWLTVSGSTQEALAWYTSAEKIFATSDRDMPALLYWHAATMIQGGQVGRQGQRADKIRELLNRVVYDYPRSEYSALARIAIEQIDQQN